MNERHHEKAYLEAHMVPDDDSYLIRRMLNNKAERSIIIYQMTHPSWNEEQHCK